MGRELSHTEVVDLLGAYALDALDPAERQAVDDHAAGCPSCVDEIAEHREVAGLLTPGWGAPPAGLWEKIASSLVEVPPPLDLAPVIAMKRREGQLRAPVRPRNRIGLGIAAMVAAAAVAMIGILGVRVADDRQRINQLALGAHGDELVRSANAALADPGAHKVSLVSTDGYRTAQAVVLPDGTGYVVSNNLPGLAKERTYQLWAVVGTTRISVGVLGAEPHIVPFKIGGNVSALAITDETAGGVPTTTRDPVVIGKVQDT
jgi:anti-sigma factor RsiW